MKPEADRSDARIRPAGGDTGLAAIHTDPAGAPEPAILTIGFSQMPMRMPGPYTHGIPTVGDRIAGPASRDRNRLGNVVKDGMARFVQCLGTRAGN